MDSIQEAIRDHLTERGEPTMYLALHTAALVKLKTDHALISHDLPMDEVIRNAGNAIQGALLGDDKLVHYGGGESVDTGLWGLSSEMESAEPLSDRVEMAVVKFLIEHPNCTFDAILRDLSTQFPGLLTPSPGLVRAVLDSYAEQNRDQWRLGREDFPAARKTELTQMAGLIRSIGERLDYGTNPIDDRTLVWEAGEMSEYVFYLKASAILDRTLLESRYPRERSLVVMPEARVALLEYKLKRDPALAARLGGLGAMNFQTVRRLATLPVLDRAAFETQIQGDSAQEKQGQLRLL